MSTIIEEWRFGHEQEIIGISGDISCSSDDIMLEKYNDALSRLCLLARGSFKSSLGVRAYSTKVGESLGYVSLGSLILEKVCAVLGRICVGQRKILAG